MYRFETIHLGEYKGEDYFLVGFVEPEPGANFDPETDANEYGVSLARTSAHPIAETIEIVRLDSAHGEPHLDKTHLPSNINLDRKIWLEAGVSYRWMKQYLLVYWKEFVDLYLRINEYLLTARRTLPSQRLTEWTRWASDRRTGEPSPIRADRPSTT